MTKVTTEQASDSGTTVLWCGTEESFDAYLRAREAITAGLVAGTLDIKAFSGDNAAQGSHLLTRDGNVGIVTIAGPLTNEDSPFNRFFGLTSYPDVQRAFQEAAMDPNIKVIASNYGSGGGAVNGVHDTAMMIKHINDNIKPVHTYTGSTMASAALWLGASAKTISVGSTAVTGSIGILQVHTETSKMMADMGVKRTVIRAGQYKALVNPHEPLTEAARAQTEKMMGEIYGVFMGHVASARKMDYAKADAAFGQGREFVGQQAVDVGLASQVTSFDKFIANLQQQVDKNTGDPHNSGNYQRGKAMTLKALSQATADAMKASGLTDEQIIAADEKAFEANTKAAADAAEKAAKEAAAALAAAAQGTSQLSAQALLDKTITLTGELTTAKAALTEAQAKVAPLEAAMESCRGIVTASLNAMTIAMGGSPKDMKATSIVDLLKAHSEAEVGFKAKYPNGQVSATSAVTTETDKTAEPEWARTAAAVASSKKA